MVGRGIAAAGNYRNQVADINDGIVARQPPCACTP
jgi:hypothetical protein